MLPFFPKNIHESFSLNQTLHGTFKLGLISKCLWNKVGFRDNNVYNNVPISNIHINC